RPAPHRVRQAAAARIARRARRVRCGMLRTHRRGASRIPKRAAPPRRRHGVLRTSAMSPSMNYSEYRAFSDFVNQRQIVFYYYGFFSQNIISAMADTIKLSMKQSDSAPSTKRKLFSCFIEMAQNIIHYSSAALTPAAQDDDEIRQGSVCIGR